MGEGGCEAHSAPGLDSERVGGRRAGDPRGARGAGGRAAPAGPGALSRVLARLAARRLQRGGEGGPEESQRTTDWRIV